MFSPLLAGSSLPPASAGGSSGLNFRGLSALERGFSMQALAIFGGWSEIHPMAKGGIIRKFSKGTPWRRRLA
jgi:hypothetical protein